MLYKTCILPIALYAFSLWHYNKVPLLFPLKELNKMQWQIALWVLGTFSISSSMEIKTIASLIPIHIYLCKLSDRNQLQIATLSYNHIIKSLLKRRHSKISITLSHSRKYDFQVATKIKSSIIDMNNWLNVIFTTFNFLNFKCYPGGRLINIFSSWIFFHNANCSPNKSKEAHCKKLNKIVLKLSSDPKIDIVITDTSIKNFLYFSYPFL